MLTKTVDPGNLVHASVAKQKGVNRIFVSRAVRYSCTYKKRVRTRQYIVTIIVITQHVFLFLDLFNFYGDNGRSAE